MVTGIDDGILDEVREYGHGWEELKDMLLD